MLLNTTIFVYFHLLARSRYASATYKEEGCTTPARTCRRAWRLAAGNMPSVTAFPSPAGTAKGHRNLAGPTPRDGLATIDGDHTTTPSTNYSDAYRNCDHHHYPSCFFKFTAAIWRTSSTLLVALKTGIIGPPVTLRCCW